MQKPALNDIPSQSYGMPLAMWDYTVLAVTTSECTPTLITARGRYSIFLPRMDGRLSELT